MKLVATIAALVAALTLVPSALAHPIESTFPSSQPTALWVGDSYTEGAGSTNPWLYGEAHGVSQAFGWHLALDAIGGTGFVAPSKYGPPFWERLSRDKANVPSPDYVVIDGGRNDHGSLTAETQAVTSYFNAITRDFPNARVLVIAPWIMRSQPTDYLAARCLLESQAVSRGWTYIDPLSEGWVGPATFPLVAADDVHPDDAGYGYLEGQLVPAIANALLTPPIGPSDSCLTGV